MAGRPPLKLAPLFGQRLAAIRKRKGLSQAQLAKLIGISRQMIDYYERRAPNPSLDFIRRASRALDVSLDELLGNDAFLTHSRSRSRSRPGPSPQLLLRFEQIRLLPRKHQDFILNFIDAYLLMISKS